MDHRTALPERVNILLHMLNILWLMPAKRAASDERVDDGRPSTTTAGSNDSD